MPRPAFRTLSLHLGLQISSQPHPREAAGRVCNFKRALGERAGLMAAPSSNSAIRKALRQFEDGLQTFCGQLATETAEVGAPAGCRTAPEAQSTQECDRGLTCPLPSCPHRC